MRSLLVQKVGSRSQVYSARAKLMLISNQAIDLGGKCFEGESFIYPFKKLVFIQEFE